MQRQSGSSRHLETSARLSCVKAQTVVTNWPARSILLPSHCEPCRRGRCFTPPSPHPRLGPTHTPAYRRNTTQHEVSTTLAPVLEPASARLSLPPMFKIARPWAV